MASQPANPRGVRNQDGALRSLVPPICGAVDRHPPPRVLGPYPFWTTADLESKLVDFKAYFNHHRAHTARWGRPPEDARPGPIAKLESYRWESHCRGLHQT